MLSYFQEYFIERLWGISYLVTTAAMVVGAILLLREFSKWWKAVLEIVCGYFCYFVLLSSYFAFFDNWEMDRVVLIIFVALYALFRSNCNRTAAVVRSFMYVASAIVIIPVSEPLGIFLDGIWEGSYGWAQYLTAVVVIVMIGLLVWYLRHFSLGGKSMIHTQYIVVQCVIATITFAMEEYVSISHFAYENRMWNVLMCLSFWFIGLLTYYLFYTVYQAAEQNSQLIALQKKNEMEREKFQITRGAYDELAVMRHEIKNHNFYLKELLNEGMIAEAKEYLGNITSKGDRYLKSFDSGNYAVDVVLTHEIAMAREQGVTIEPKILVPQKLPYPDEDICSLLSNILDNAIEAAARSGEEPPVVNISMMPKKEYLFIRTTNPVDKNVPYKQRMSLETTKTESMQLHGYGTRIIRRIAEQYNGSVKYSMGAGEFVTDVMMELPGNRGDYENLEDSDL